MQQTFDSSLAPNNWFALARVSGIFRYHLRTLGKTVLWVLGVLLGSNLIGLLLPAFFPDIEFSMGGISANLGTALLFSFICGCIVAGRSTRFLLRFGTPRFSVWLCSLLSLMAAMAALLLGTLLSNILTGYLSLALSQSLPSYALVGYTERGLMEGPALMAVSLSESISYLPTQLLWIAEWVCLHYLFGCCLRRNKGLTLTIALGLPLALMILTVIPAVRETLDAVTSENTRQIMALGLQWMQWLVKAVRFLIDKWPTVQLILAVASLPLSYLCMRGTKQP